MSKLRINHICPSFNNKIYQFLVEEQIDLDNDVRVFYFTQKNKGLPNGDKPYVDGVSPFTFVDRFFYFIKEQKVYSAYRKIYYEADFDIIHAHTLFTSGYIAYKLKKKHNIPYVVAVRGTDVNLFFRQRFYLRRIGISIMQNAGAVVFISPSHMNEVLHTYIPKNKVETIRQKCYMIPNGIDDFWHEKEYNHPSPESGRIKLIYYGDINKNKNIAATIKACDLLKDRGYSIKFKVIGKIFEKSITKLLEEKDYIEYIGFSPKEEIISYLRASDIFVMPSFSETFGLTYVEAMSQGVPVIFTKGQGFDGFFPDGHVGYRVDPGNPSMIADRIIDILGNYKQISGNCVVGSRRFSWEKIAQTYQSLYYMVCGLSGEGNNRI